ncbi:MAG TPA: hypothetical protein VHD84_00990 [Candidatus Saccharimonadales bacterium]|nr:hypothetical protein [Candidatus Saccharimonadales bacterium]
MKKLKLASKNNLVKHLLVALVMLLVAIPSVPAFAQCTDNTPSCGGPSGNTGSDNTQQLSSSLKSNPIVKDLNDIVSFLGAGVGIVVIASLIIGGIQYSMAGDSSDAVSKAKHRITNGLIALVAYLLIFGFLQWIIPGGVFNS